MGWPQSQDYNEAVQNPTSVFGDAELRGGQAVRNVLGLPMPRSGNFADVYEFIGASGQKWAVKCFTRQIPGLQERYDEISKHLVRAKLPFTVDFSYLAKGIHINGGFYPILKMRWVEGSLLNVFVRDNLDKPALLNGLSQVWLRMAKSLAKSGIAHADLQHGNIMFVPGRKAAKLAVKLIDYDGMWLPALAEKKSGEVGHPNYQHPERLRSGTYSAAVDRLPLLAIACALRCLAVRGKPLWDKYDNGDNLLFRETDLREPGASELFKELWNLKDPASHYLTGYLAAALTHGLDETPHLQALTNGDEVRPLAVAEEEYVTALLGRGALVSRSVTPVAAINETFKVKPNTPLPPRFARTSHAGDSDWDIADDEETVPRFRRKSSFAATTKMWLALGAAVGLCVGAVIGLWILRWGIAGNAGDVAAIGRELDGAERAFKKQKGAPVKPKPSPAEPKHNQKRDYRNETIYLSEMLPISHVALELKTGNFSVSDKSYSKSLFLHPPHPPPGGPSFVRYVLPGASKAIFKATVGISDAAQRPASELTFEVFGDCNRLWQSTPIQDLGVHQECVIDVSGNRVLELRISCSGAPWWAHGVWGDARLEITDREGNKDTGKRFLVEMPEDEVKMGPWRFGKGDCGDPGANHISISGTKSPNGLGLHPPENGFASVKYDIEKIGRTFRATVGINDTSNEGVATPLIFEVLGDGNLLWRSQAINKAGVGQQCQIGIIGVKFLELRVQCAGGSFGAHAVWAEPFIEKMERVPTEQFVAIFNGKDLTGWKQFPAQNNNWHVRNGTVFGYGQTGSYLVTDRDDYKDFRLHVEARINAGGNSGIFFRSSLVGDYPRGYEADIAEDGQTLSRTGNLLGLSRGLVVIPKSPVSPGQWFTLDVTAIGNHILIKVNGKTTVDYIDKEKLFTSGRIALQQGTAQTMAEFRKVEIKEFKWGASSQQQGLWRGTEKPAPVLTSNWDHVFKMSGVKELDGYLSIPAESLICTQQKYTGPIDITAIARTAKENIRLCAFNGACVIFNWEGNPTELRVNRPDGTFRFESGSLATARVTSLLPNVWYKLRWQITKNGMKVTVDDRVVFSEIKEYDLSAKRPVYVKSATHQVDVKYFSVEPLPAASEITPVGQASPDSSPQPKFVPLFNGKDLTGWKTHPAHPGNWRVQNGVLIGSGPSPSHLFTVRETFKDFHLYAETRVNAGGNSGLFFRTLFGPGHPKGYEADIADDDRNLARTGNLLGLSSALATVRKSPIPPGQWFALEVIALGRHIVIKVNGNTTADFIDKENLFTSGHIALQQDTAGTVAEFRKIEIKELKSNALEEKINTAIDKGVAYLKRFPEQGTLVAKRPGSWALRGWALLEAGIHPNDPGVKKIVDYVRLQVPEMEQVYDLAISLILFDKLGDAADEPLIESLAVRLLAGQGTFGGWTYSVDKPHAVERARIANLIRETERLRGQGVLVKFRQRSLQEITRDVAKQLATIQIGTSTFGGDNSNTQFAMIALWVARRHGVPVSRSLALVEKRCQLSQVKSGAWGYDFPTNGAFQDDNHYTYPAMTCSGLLGLALGQGVQPQPKDLRADNQVRAGFTVIAQALAKEPPERKANYHYFLFSMERAAVVYNIKMIGAFDWYLWGAQKLVSTQAENGSWSGGFPYEGADTCFALLFLKRANVAHDLTKTLQASGADPQ